MTTKCPICFSRKTNFFFEGKDFYEKISNHAFTIFRCENCKSSFLTPSPSFEQIAGFYPKKYYSYVKSDKTSFMTRLRENTIKNSFGDSKKMSFFWKTITFFTKNKFRNLLPTYRGKDKTFLDIGCGIGENLAILNRYGWETTGIELSEQAVQVGINNGLDLRLSSLESFSAKKQFDAIRLWHVLEHVKDPHLAFKKLNSLLKKGGELYLAIPNTSSLNEKLFHKFWIGYDVPRHLLNFSPKAFRALAHRYGFKIVDYRHSSTSGLISSISNVVNSILPGKYRLANNILLVVLTYPYDLLTDFLGQGDIVYIKLKKK